MENAVTKLWSQKRAVLFLQFSHGKFMSFLEEHKAFLQSEVAVLEFVVVVMVMDLTASTIFKSRKCWLTNHKNIEKELKH